jgi:hypothetical protein
VAGYYEDGADGLSLAKDLCKLAETYERRNAPVPRASMVVRST